MPSAEKRGPWEVERDRFGVMFSGPLEVGECIEVVPLAEHDRLREALDLLREHVQTPDAATIIHRALS